MEFFIFISNECNLNCEYCSILVNTKTNDLPVSPIYSLSDLTSFIRSTQVMYNQHELDIIFFGGEPTLDFGFISNLIIEQDKELHEFTIRYVLHTNGLLLKNIPDNILYRLSAIMLSVNPLKIPSIRLNDSYFELIVSSIQYIKRKSSVPIIGRFTITEKTSLYTLVMQFHNFFDYLYWQIENCQNFFDYDNFYKAYTYDLQLLISVWEGYLKKGVILKLIPFLSCAFYHHKNIESLKFLCGFNHNMLYIQTDGLCYSCAEDFLSKNNLIGNIITGIKYPDFSIKDIRCNSCKYLNMCFGRCGRMHREFSDEHIVEYCKLNIYMFSYFIDNHEKINDICCENDILSENTSFITDYTEYVP